MRIYRKLATIIIIFITLQAQAQNKPTQVALSCPSISSKQPFLVDDIHHITTLDGEAFYTKSGFRETLATLFKANSSIFTNKGTFQPLQIESCPELSVYFVEDVYSFTDQDLLEPYSMHDTAWLNTANQKLAPYGYIIDINNSEHRACLRRNLSTYAC